MKNIWKYFVVLVFVFLLVGCKSNKKENYNVKLNVPTELLEFINFDLNYVVEEGTFQLPEVVIQDYQKYNVTNEESTIIFEQINCSVTSIGWVDSNNNPVSTNQVEITSNSEFTLKCTISEKVKTVNINVNGGSFESLNEVRGNILILPIPTKEDCDFQGWYTNPNFISSKIDSIDFSAINKQTNVYAKFTVSSQYIIRLINELPEQLTIDDIEQLKFVQSEYNRLPTSEKGNITNYNKLNDAYEKLEALEVAKEFYDKLTDLYQKEVTIELKDEVENIQELLEQLDESAFEYMPNVDLTRLDEIVDEIEAILALYEEDAKAFDKAVVSIPIYNEEYYSTEIESLYNEYLSFNDEMKALLTSTHKLERLYQNLQEINNLSTIYYLNPETTRNVYLSKQELCEAFFTDFYYYIVAYHGTKHLENNGLYDVYDFVELSQDFTGAGANNLYGIGNIAGRYMLQKEINGILENQTDGAFFGFCYQNNIYQDVLPFFINFFAYWRIDEKYANTSNYGADIFAEAWAPTVDIAKFFYYDENTSYVKTDRMIDCLTNTASVVYGMDEDPQNIRMRGYEFKGWYDNPEFSGSPITDLTKYKKVYAKWEIDEEQKDADAANLVDVYIYNLTTSKAVVNSVTVGYVKDMYNNLSNNGKSLVKNYSTLQKYINNYQ